MNFQEAINNLNNGKKIRRTCWENGHYWVLNEDKHLVNSKGDNPILNRTQMQMSDWEIYKESFDLTLWVKNGVFSGEIRKIKEDNFKKEYILIDYKYWIKLKEKI